MKVFRADVLQLDDDHYVISASNEFNNKCVALKKAADWALNFLNEIGKDFVLKCCERDHEYMISSIEGCSHCPITPKHDLRHCDQLEITIRQTIITFHPDLVAHFLGCKKADHKKCALVMTFT